MSKVLPPAGQPIRSRIAAVITGRWGNGDNEGGFDDHSVYITEHATAQIAEAIIIELGLTVESAPLAAKLGYPNRRRWVTPWEHTPDDRQDQ